MKVLRQIPNSVLWLRIDQSQAIDNLRKYAAAAGIEPDRLIFSEKVSMPEHLARHRLADLFVDTYPYNQHSTAGDALRMGLPLVTYSGETMASRVAGSYLRALGLDELITENLEAYESKILELLRKPNELQRLREALSEKLKATDLFDGRAFARKIELAYREIRDLHLSSRLNQRYS